MIKQITVAECDICGRTDKAKTRYGQYNETDYVLPDGWVKSPVNGKVCLCPMCWKAVQARKGNAE